MNANKGECLEELPPDIISGKVNEYWNGKDEALKLHESSIASLIKMYPEHSSEEKVLAKVVLIDKFYSTQLNTFVSTKKVSVVDMAKRIAELEGLKNQICEATIKNLELAIKAVNAIGEWGSDHDNAFSFASKYCNWHNECIPITDSYTRGFLYYWYSKKERKYTQNKLKDYKVYCDAFVRFMEENNLENQYTVKQIDWFLWQYGKDNNLRYD